MFRAPAFRASSSLLPKKQDTKQQQNRTKNSSKRNYATEGRSNNVATKISCIIEVFRLLKTQALIPAMRKQTSFSTLSQLKTHKNQLLSVADFLQNCHHNIICQAPKDPKIVNLEQDYASENWGLNTEYATLR